jgi:hypothetical protein
MTQYVTENRKGLITEAEFMDKLWGERVGYQAILQRTA